MPVTPLGVLCPSTARSQAILQLIVSSAQNIAGLDQAVDFPTGAPSSPPPRAPRCIHCFLVIVPTQLPAQQGEWQPASGAPTQTLRRFRAAGAHGEDTAPGTPGLPRRPELSLALPGALTPASRAHGDGGGTSSQGSSSGGGDGPPLSPAHVQEAQALLQQVARVSAQQAQHEEAAQALAEGMGVESPTAAGRRAHVQLPPAPVFAGVFANLEHQSQAGDDDDDALSASPSRGQLSRSPSQRGPLSRLPSQRSLARLPSQRSLAKSPSRRSLSARPSASGAAAPGGRSAGQGEASGAERASREDEEEDEEGEGRGEGGTGGKGEGGAGGLGQGAAVLVEREMTEV